MLALLFFALVLPLALFVFCAGLALGARRGYARGQRDGRRKLFNVLRRMVEDDEYNAQVVAAGRTVMAPDDAPEGGQS